VPDNTHERADSRRKRLRLIEAARLAVAEHGVEVSAAEIASRAEVGVGTLYRRFGTKDALIVDVVVDSFAELQVELDQAVADDDSWRGFVSFMTAHTRNLVVNRGLSEVIAPERKLEEPILEPLRKLQRSCEIITTRAQQEGIVRSDLTWRDVLLLSYSASCMAPHVGIVGGSDQWRRTLTVVLDGIRSPTQLLPGTAPTDMQSLD
jgi:AcrR family transcriptional regulator